MQYDDHTNSTESLFSTNHLVADHLLETANILRQKGANPYRIRAYRSAARTIETLDKDLANIIEQEDIDGLVKLPFVGKHIAYAIYELVATGKWNFLESLRNSLKPPDVFKLIPGVGPKLAEKIYKILNVKTLDELEIAANIGKLAEIPGIGGRRQRMITETLSSILHDTRQSHHIQRDGPNVESLLKIDRVYRKKARDGSLKTIAPKRFNPSAKAWLPIMHYQNKNWQYRIMYSNTERAHRLHKSSDWVIIHAYDDMHHEYHRTIVTETRGTLKGKRVVRGYENECIQYYEKM